MKKTFSRGFTLIELLVVIAIIGILSAVVLASLNTARAKGGDAAVKANLNGIRPQAELYYDSNNNSYGTAAAVCTGGMFAADANIAKALTAARTAGSGTTACVSVGTPANAWGIAANLKTASGTYWCVDSTGNATSTTNSTPVNASTAACQ